MTGENTALARYARLAEQLNQASGRWGGVQILPVTKTVPADRILPLKAAGVRAIGENRVQEAMEKLPLLAGAFRVHIIGRLQTNKAKYAARFADMVQSLDRAALADALSRALTNEGRALDVLIEVNAAGDPAKAGIRPEDAADFLALLSRHPRLRVRGLMTVAPAFVNPEDARGVFRRMRALFDELRAGPGAEMDTLSMGMSADCLVAAEEGATLARVGSAIFGERA